MKYSVKKSSEFNRLKMEASLAERCRLEDDIKIDQEVG